MGDEGGERDLDNALEIALAANSPTAATALNNLGVIASMHDLARENALMRECSQVAERMGDREIMRFAQGNLVWSDFALGRWDKALEDANAFIAECESGSPHNLEDFIRDTRATIHLARGDVGAALEDLRHARELARQAKDPQARLPSLGVSARAYLLLGRTDEARAFAADFLSGLRELSETPGFLGIVARYADELGIAADVRELAADMQPSRVKDATSAEVDGDFERAADAHAQLGFVTGEAEDRLLAAEHLIEVGRRVEGEAQLEKALAFYRSVGATFFIRRGESLLGRSAQSESA